MNTFNQKIINPATGELTGTGWLPPRPDLRDYTENHKEIQNILKNAKPGTLNTERGTLNSKQSSVVDLRKWCSPVENQGSLGSCTAHAGVGVIEYFQNRAFGKYTNGSRLFLYKTTRNLMQTTGDTGGWLRSTMGAIVLCGIAPEKYYPYNISDFDKEPESFIYSIADNYKAIKYFCHDPIVGREGERRRGREGERGGEGLATISQTVVLESVKKYLSAGIPSMFGFWGFPSYKDSDIPGAIPYPCPGETAIWGHAVVAIGFDDSITIKSTRCSSETTGALLIRNSWGSSWGDKGYGWLPYRYVLDKLALDFWSLISSAWIDTNQFGF
jgi:C1A family cysteine protease